MRSYNAGLWDVVDLKIQNSGIVVPQMTNSKW